MNIDKKLNFVVPVERLDGVTIYVHATPISREVFDQFFIVIGQTFNMIYTSGFGYVSGPRLATKILRKLAADISPVEADRVEKGLFAEVRRLSNVLVSGNGGWTSVPYHIALEQGLIDADDADEVENAITFFIVASAMHKRKELPPILAEAGRIWSAQITSSNSTVFAASLPTSMPVVSSGAKAPQSSIPS